MDNVEFIAKAKRAAALAKCMTDISNCIPDGMDFQEAIDACIMVGAILAGHRNQDLRDFAANAARLYIAIINEIPRESVPSITAHIASAGGEA